MFHPALKQITIHRSIESKWSHNVTTVLRGNDAGPCKMPAANFTDHFFPARGISIFTRIILVKTALINVIQLTVFRERRYFVYELFPLLLVSFSIPDSVFLRVIPMTFFALRIPETLQLKATAVSLFVLYGFSRYHWSSFSRSILYAVRFSGLFANDPVSASRFSQSRSVFSPSPNILLTSAFVCPLRTACRAHSRKSFEYDMLPSLP